MAGMSVLSCRVGSGGFCERFALVRRGRRRGRERVVGRHDRDELGRRVLAPMRAGASGSALASSPARRCARSSRPSCSAARRCVSSGPQYALVRLVGPGDRVPGCHPPWASCSQPRGRGDGCVRVRLDRAAPRSGRGRRAPSRRAARSDAPPRPRRWTSDRHRRAPAAPAARRRAGRRAPVLILLESHFTLSRGPFAAVEAEGSSAQVGWTACRKSSPACPSASASASPSPVVSTPPSPSRGCARRGRCPARTPPTSASPTSPMSTRCPTVPSSTAPRSRASSTARPRSSKRASSPCSAARSTSAPAARPTSTPRPSVARSPAPCSCAP